MDRRSWPWKKKSSEKGVSSVDPSDSSFASPSGNQGNQENYISVDYVRISAETYAHFTELEGQVKILNEKVSSLNEKLSSSQSEITTKDNMVKQHVKVAEEAVSGWEKAEAEALALKNQLESVTQQKLTAEDRASHLDGALKECMRQIRNVKEESEQRLHDAVLTKTKQWEQVKMELDVQIANLEQEILRSSAENAALSRSLQERSNKLMKITEEKCQADAEIEVLKTELQSYDKEISSLKYEIHVVSKELEIRNEEKSMSLRSAEVVNKQYLEGVKKIAKLEAECQRLRGLVRKKLPGPAALAQMKLEVENLGRDYGEPKVRRSPSKVSSPHLDPTSDFGLDIQQYHKETDLLSGRLLAMEEETKMLKEALSKRNSELQTSRNMCAKTSIRLRSLESQLQSLNQSKGAANPNIQTPQLPNEGSFIAASNPPSLSSMSEDGIYEAGSFSDSCGPSIISDLSHFKKEKKADFIDKADSSNRLELMDDFLEMERLACLSGDSSGTIIMTHKSNKIENSNPNTLMASNSSTNFVPSRDDASTEENESGTSKAMLIKLKSKLSFIFEPQAEDSDIWKILEGMKRIVQDTQDALTHSFSSNLEETHAIDVDAASSKKLVPEDKEEIADTSISIINESNPCSDEKNPLDAELSEAISQIHDFVTSFGKETSKMLGCPDASLLCEKIEMFSSSVNKILCGQKSVIDFVLGLSHVLGELSGLNLNILNSKWHEGESFNSDCIDKVTLQEKNVVQLDISKERFSIDRLASDPEILKEGRFDANFEQKTEFQFSGEFEQLRSEREKLVMDLARCTESWEHAKIKSQETEKLLAELKSELAASQKSNGLADTQLKCMAESYNSLEAHAQELEKELNSQRMKAEALDAELQEEKHNLNDALARCKDLEDQIQRTERCNTCLNSSSAGNDVKTKQEREIEAAAEKLAECQETIFLLSKQLKGLHSSKDPASFPYTERLQTNEVPFENVISPTHRNPPTTYSLRDFVEDDMENAASATRNKGGESPLNGFITPSSPSDTEGSRTRATIKSKHPKHRPTKSSSSSSSSAPVLEKNSRSFSRFFLMGKSVQLDSA